MQLNENTVGVWYVEFPPSFKQDWMGALSKIEGEEELYEFVYRFRYYHSDDPFDEQDKKNWYRLAMKEPRPLKEFINSIDTIAAALPGQCTKLLRGEGTFDQFMDEFLQLPFVHTRTEPAATQDLGHA